MRIPLAGLFLSKLPTDNPSYENIQYIRALYPSFRTLFLEVIGHPDWNLQPRLSRAQLLAQREHFNPRRIVDDLAETYPLIFTATVISAITLNIGKLPAHDLHDELCDFENYRRKVHDKDKIAHCPCGHEWNLVCGKYLFWVALQLYYVRVNACILAILADLDLCSASGTRSSRFRLRCLSPSLIASCSFSART